MRQAHAAVQAFVSGGADILFARVARLCRATGTRLVSRAPALLIACACLLLAAPVARGQNALQQFAMGMQGPSVAVASSTFDIDANDEVSALDAVGYQFFKTIYLENMSCIAAVPNAKFYAGRQLAYADSTLVLGAETTMRIRPGALCTPDNGQTAASFAWVGVSHDTRRPSDKTERWAQVGFVHGRNFVPRPPCDPSPPAEFTRLYFELAAGDPTAPCAQGTYKRVWPPATPPLGQLLRFGVLQSNVATGEWRGYVYDEDAEQFLYLDEVTLPGWVGLTADALAFLGEVTLHPGDRMVGTASAKFAFIDCSQTILTGAGPGTYSADFLSLPWSVAKSPLHGQTAISQDRLLIWDKRP